MSASQVAKLISAMTSRLPEAQIPTKILRLRERNVDFTLGKNGVLKRVMGNRFVKNKYTHIQLGGVVRKASISQGMYYPMVWID